MSELLKVVVKELDDRLASNIEVIDLRGISPFTDYFVVAGASNQRLANAMINGVIEKATKNNYDYRSIEGKGDSDWILLDLYEVVVHVFKEEAREVYQLEKLWGDLPRVNIDDLL